MRRFVVAIVLAACSSDETPVNAPKPITAVAAETGKSTPDASAPPATTTPPPPASDDATDEEPEPEPEEHSGEATYYAPGTTGACGIKTPADKLVGALGPSFYSKSTCGQCAVVTGPKGSVAVLLNERCPGCKGASMDLATQAFTQIADTSDGRVKITWHYTDCP